MLKWLLIQSLLILIHSTCIDKSCIVCKSFIKNQTLKEKCSLCDVNYVIENQRCKVDLKRILMIIVIGVCCIGVSFILRHLLIIRNSRKPLVYTLDYQQAVFQFVTKKQVKDRNKSRRRAFGAPGTERRLDVIEQQANEDQTYQCDYCKSQLQQSFIVDTFCRCSHKFHCHCLKKYHRKMLQQPFRNTSECPTCKQKISFLTIYCQSCHYYPQKVEVDSPNSFFLLFSFVCFKCRVAADNKRKEQRGRLCCGVGKYLCFCD